MSFYRIVNFLRLSGIYPLIFNNIGILKAIKYNKMRFSWFMKHYKKRIHSIWHIFTLKTIFMIMLLVDMVLSDITDTARKYTAH